MGWFSGLARGEVVETAGSSLDGSGNARWYLARPARQRQIRSSDTSTGIGQPAAALSLMNARRLAPGKALGPARS
jgi:hypothetical protein